MRKALNTVLLATRGGWSLSRYTAVNSQKQTRHRNLMAMNSPQSFTWQFSAGDTITPLRSLIYLRLLILVLVSLSLLTWWWLNEIFQYWQVPALTVLAAGAWSIFVLRSARRQKLPQIELRELLVDIVWVFIVVVFAGGGTNPFIYYYLVLTAFSAILLPGQRPWFICMLCIFLYSAIFVADVEKHFEHISSDYKTHLLGMWINYVSSAIVICFFMTKLMSVLRAQQETLMINRENNLKNEQLIGLATVSAVTVHNLATPLSTLTVLVEDLSQSDNQDEEIKQDLKMMKEQIRRCRSTMQELSFLAETSDVKMPLSIRQLMANLRDHYALHEVNRPPVFSQDVEDGGFIQCSPLFEYALVNLINNAVESSHTQAEVGFTIRNASLIIEIHNQCHQSLDELEKKWGNVSDSSKDNGLGIGSLLANSTIERQGGKVELAVRTTQAHGEKSGVKIATVTVSFPLSTDISEKRKNRE